MPGMSWSPLLEDLRTRKGQKEEAGRPPVCVEWGSPLKHVKVPGPSLVVRTWEMAPWGKREILPLTKHLPYALAPEVSVLHSLYRWRSSHPQTARQVLCSKFTAMPPPTTPLGPKLHAEAAQKKNA